MIFGLLIGYCVNALLAVFVTWDLQYLNLGVWPWPARVLYVVIQAAVFAVLYEIFWRKE